MLNIRAIIYTAILLAGSPVLSVPQAFSQGFTKQVTIVVPFSPGGIADLMARLTAGHLKNRINQPVVVENRPGAGALLAGRYVSAAPPDGHVILCTTGSIALSQLLVKDANFDVRKDLTALTLAAEGPSALVVNASLPVTTVREFVAYAKANAGKLNSGSVGYSSTTRLMTAWFEHVAGFTSILVPYPGTAPAHLALLQNEVQVLWDEPTLAARDMGPGSTIRILALSGGDGRSSLLPTVPTLAESGYDIDYRNRMGFFLPPKTPRDIVERVNAEIVSILRLPEIKGNTALKGWDVVGTTSERYAKLVSDDIDRWAEIVKAAGIEPQ